MAARAAEAPAPPPGGAALSLEACCAHSLRWPGRLPLAVVDRIDSTNALARRVAGAYLSTGRAVPRLTIVARSQTAGRGRRGRVWASPPGSGIYTSLLLPVTRPDALAVLPLSVPLALCGALDALGVECAIKWPNDLIVGGRKLGGVLIESLAGRAAIVGYGINGTQDAVELPAPAATSLRLEIGSPPDLSSLAPELAMAVVDYLSRRQPATSVIDAYRRRSAHRPGDRLRCRLGGETVAGRFLGFDEGGRLRLETADGERLLSSAEVVEEGAGGGLAPEARS